VNAFRQFGFAFTSDAAGRCNFCGLAVDVLSQSTTEYNDIVNAGDTWNATEANRQIFGGITSFRLSGMRVKLSDDPGLGNSYALTLRKNGASPAGTPSVTIADLNTTGVDSSGSLTITSSDLIAIESVPASGPAIESATWGFIQDAN
jgi:hypothetical protein